MATDKEFGKEIVRICELLERGQQYFYSDLKGTTRIAPTRHNIEFIKKVKEDPVITFKQILEKLGEKLSEFEYPEDEMFISYHEVEECVDFLNSKGFTVHEIYIDERNMDLITEEVFEKRYPYAPGAESRICEIIGIPVMPSKSDWRLPQFLVEMPDRSRGECEDETER